MPAYCDQRLDKIPEITARGRMWERKKGLADHAEGDGEDDDAQDQTINDEGGEG